MSMREEVLKLAEECGFEFFKATKYESETLANRAGHNIEAFERFYQAAYQAGAKAMQGEAEKRCEKDLYRGEHFAEVIHTINLESLSNK